ncbi:hypothetical protein [Corynebacterium vitaeruminis]|uniref:hypothetical protein n=1 Tax=Corynebacterium vitaeruminis TaxID=38305 RepID=UPI000558F9CA|nr:hypothetical protein [Corynebacterium vitaeruminis]
MAKTRFKDYPQVPPLVPATIELRRHGHYTTRIEHVVLVQDGNELELGRDECEAIRWACEHDRKGGFTGAIRDTSSIAQAFPSYTSGTAYTQLKAHLRTFPGVGWTVAGGRLERVSGVKLQAPEAWLDHPDGTSTRLDEGAVTALRVAAETRRLPTGTDRLTPISSTSQIAEIERRMKEFRRLTDALPDMFRRMAEEQDARIRAAEAKLALVREAVEEAKARAAEEAKRQAEEKARQEREEQARRAEAARKAEEERQALEAATPAFETFDAEQEAKAEHLQALLAQIRTLDEELKDQ